jgi:uroporphyrinogen-III synthase
MHLPVKPLAGLGVLVTRPAEQAGPLVHLLEGAGARVLQLPALVIAPGVDPQQAAGVLAHLRELNLAIFVSANAVRHGMPLIQGHGGLPPHVPIAAVGEATARGLHAAGIAEVITPAPRYDSEALLALPALRAVAGARVLIVCGAGGRELLAETLRARGARVERLECYRRIPPQVDPQPVIDAWQRGAIDIVSVTSVEALRNLHALLGPNGRACLLRTPLVVVSARMAQAARELAVREPVIVSRAASDGAILDAILAWASEREA